MDALPTDRIEAPCAWPVETLRFAPRSEASGGGSAQRLGIGAGVLLLHVLFWGLFEAESRSRAHEAAHDDAALVVDWIETLPPQLIVADALPPPRATARPQRAVAARRPSGATVRPQRTPRARSAAPVPLQLYRADGSVRLPEGLLADIDPLADDRPFDFRMPDLGKAARLLDRPPALVYEPTRFDAYWEPQEDLLSEVLRKAVEKTTKEVRIPIPGAPGRFLVCRVSLLAAGGACGVERNGGNAVVALDDPTTLSPAEAAACEAWWDRIAGATTQDEWRATRKLYEAECRKPLAKAAPPEPAGAQ